MANDKMSKKQKALQLKRDRKKAASDEVAPMAPPPPAVVDYNQPLKSPYTRSVWLRIGSSTYHVPEAYLDQYIKLRQELHWDELALRDVDEDIGHTVVHFLYTGGYETLQVAVGDPTQAVALEFERAVQVYHAAHVYEIHGLKELAKTYITKLGGELPVFSVMKGVQKVHSKLPSNESWLEDYLHTRLQRAFDEDEDTFKKDEFYSDLGDNHRFHQTVMKIVVSIYSSTVSSLRACATDSSPVEPVPSQHIEQEYPPTPRQSSLEAVPEDPPAGPVEADEVPVEACVDDGRDLPVVIPLDAHDYPPEPHPVPVY